MVGDVIQTKSASPHGGVGTRHVAARRCSRVCVCTLLWAHVCARRTREIKLPFQDNTISLCFMPLICASIFIIFFVMWDFVLYALSAQVM